MEGCESVRNSRISLGVFILLAICLILVVMCWGYVEIVINGGAYNG